MLNVKITSGIYGYRTEPSGPVEPKGVGDICSVSEDEAARLVRLGVAEIIDAALNQQPFEYRADDNAVMDEAKLKKMSKAELLSLAIDFGIDGDLPEGATKAQIIAAIIAADADSATTESEGEDGEDSAPPTNDAAEDAVV